MKLPPLFGNFIIIVLGWMEDRRRWAQEIEDFVANEENEEILEFTDERGSAGQDIEEINAIEENEQILI